MARSIQSGVPGLEVPHRIVGPYSSFQMNVRSARPSRVRLTGLKGWHSLAEADDNREARVGRRGENIYPSAARGKTVVYEGELQSKTLEGLRTLEALFDKACATDRSSELQVKIEDPEVPWMFHARVIDKEIDDKQEKGLNTVWPWTRTFQLSLRLGDGRFYVDNGGAAYSANASGAVVHVKHEGSSTTEPHFVMNVTGGTVTFGNGSIFTPGDPEGLTFAQLHFTGMPAGFLVVDFATREITLGGADASKYLNIPLSNWWDEDQWGLVPGDNELTAFGGEWGVSFFHASEG